MRLYPQDGIDFRLGTASGKVSEIRTGYASQNVTDRAFGKGDSTDAAPLCCSEANSRRHSKPSSRPR